MEIRKTDRCFGDMQQDTTLLRKKTALHKERLVKWQSATSFSINALRVFVVVVAVVVFYQI